MRFGVCCNYDKAKHLAKCGYDYIELSLFKVADMSDGEFEKCKKKLNKAGLISEVLNGFFPKDFVIVGPDADREILDKYVDKALLRASELGAKVLVLGSGGARRVQGGWDRDECIKQFCDLAHSVGIKAEKYGIKIALEPLSLKETNFINFVSEGAEIASAVGLENVGTMVDFFHFSQNGEDIADLITSSDKIFHVHLARGADDRGVPTIDDIAELNIWAEALENIGYDGRMSMEARYENFDKEIKNGRRMLDIFNGVDKKHI